MHCDSHDSGMAATLIHPKSFMKSLSNCATNSTEAGEGAISTSNGSAAANGCQSGNGVFSATPALHPFAGVTASGSGVGGMQTFLPVSTSLINQLLPNSHNQQCSQTASTATLLQQHFTSAASNSFSPFFALSTSTTDSSNSATSSSKVTQYRSTTNDSISRMDSQATITNAADGINSNSQHIYLNQQPTAQQTFMLTSHRSESTSQSSMNMQKVDTWGTTELLAISNASFASSAAAQSGPYDGMCATSSQLGQLYQHDSVNQHLMSSTDSFAGQQQDFVELDDSSSHCTNAIFSDTQSFNSHGHGDESLSLTCTAADKFTNDTIPMNTYCSVDENSLTTSQYQHISIADTVSSSVSFDSSPSFVNASGQLQLSANVDSKPVTNANSSTATSNIASILTDTDLPNSTKKDNGGNAIADLENEGIDGAEPEIDIVINNVVCSFSVRCHLNLRDIALNGDNVEFRRENGMVTMKLRRPYTTASIWSSGKITCTGATSEDQAKIAARRYTRCLQKLGFNVRFRNFRVVNVLGTCSMPWGIMIVNFSEKYKKDASYEPELHPGVTYRLERPKATLKIFSTGSITVTAASVAFVQAAIEHIFPLVYEFRKKRSHHEKLELMKQQTALDTHDIDSLIVEECDIDLMSDPVQSKQCNTGEQDALEERENAEKSNTNYLAYSGASQDQIHNGYNTNTKASYKTNSIRAAKNENTSVMGLRNHPSGLIANAGSNKVDIV